MKTKAFEIIGKVVVGTIVTTGAAAAVAGAGFIGGLIGGVVGAAIVEKNFTPEELKDLEDDKDVKEAKEMFKGTQDDVTEQAKKTEEN